MPSGRVSWCCQVLPTGQAQSLSMVSRATRAAPLEQPDGLSQCLAPGRLEVGAGARPGGRGSVAPSPSLGLGAFFPSL